MRPGREIAAELTAGARYLGSSILLAQGAGGNSSFKDFSSDTLWVKASGVSLSQNPSADAFVGLSLSAVRNTLQDSVLRSAPSRWAHETSVERFVAAVRSGGHLRPSLETGMHAALPQRVVVHTHSVYINALSCMRGSREAAFAILPSHRWVPYATPGFDLALAIENSLATGKEPQESMAIVLENHGFVAAGQSSKEAITTSDDHVAVAKDFFGSLDFSCLEQEEPAQEILDLVESIDLQSFEGEECVPLLRAGRFGIFRSETDLLVGPALHPFVPDDVVYLGPKIWRPSSMNDAAGLLHHLVECCPRFCIVVPDKGILFAAESEGLLDAMEEAALAHMLISLLISRKGAPQPMAAEDIQAIVAMESEKYRRAVAARFTLEAERCKS